MRSGARRSAAIEILCRAAFRAAKRLGRDFGEVEQLQVSVKGPGDFVSIADYVPAEIKAKIDTVKAGLKDGSFSIWKGPIVDNTGKEQIAKDAVADDAFLGGIKFYVKGVEGKVPSN